MPLTGCGKSMILFPTPLNPLTALRNALKKLAEFGTNNEGNFYGLFLRH